jgi:hypothetical protein
LFGFSEGLFELERKFCGFAESEGGFGGGFSRGLGGVFRGLRLFAGEFEGGLGSFGGGGELGSFGLGRREGELGGLGDFAGGFDSAGEFLGRGHVPC